MLFYYGTASNDNIDARELAEGYDGIDSREGDDTVYLGDRQVYVAGPGADTVIGSGASDYALWFSPGVAEINLEEEYAWDGFGERDSLSGITTIHMSNYGGTVIGSDRDEHIFYFEGDSVFDLRSGNDTVTMYQHNSSEYTTRLIDGIWYLTSPESQIEIHGVEAIEFEDQTYITPSSEYTYGQPYTAYSFIETEWSVGWWYAGVYSEPSLVSYFIQAANAMDIGADGDTDYIFPMSRGYRTGVDTRYHFIVLENVNGQLVYNDQMTSETPFITGSRRTDTIHLESLDTEALVSIAHDTAIETETRYDIPWRLGDIAILTANPFSDVTAQLIPAETLPGYELTGRDTAVNAHSMAVGDINNDGLDDILVGDWSSPFALLQTGTGVFDYQTTEFYSSLTGHWLEPTLVDATDAGLIDLHLEDLDGNGSDDLIVGWGPATVLSRVFFNDGEGGFDLDHSEPLPESLYGNDNSLHLKTFSEDFDLDGDQDLLVLYARSEPYYGGNYIQFLENDGAGGFTDTTVARLGDPELLEDTYSERLNWTDYWQVSDVNDDGALDIIGQTANYQNKKPFLYLNDGTGYFSKIDFPTLLSGQPIILDDLDGDSLLDVIVFESQSIDEASLSSINNFDIYELQTVNLDAARAYDLNGHAGEVAKTLGAVFGSDSVMNAEYAGIGLHFTDDLNYSYEELIELAISAALGTQANDFDAVVDLLYTNVVGAVPTEETHNVFVELLEQGVYSIGSLGVMAAETELNQTNIDLIGLTHAGLEYFPYGE